MEYRIISHLKDVFLNVLMFMLSATITLIILKYIRKFLRFRLAIRLYRELLDRSNITYLVREIVKPKYKHLSFLVLDNNRAGAIPKAIIFVDNIDETQYIAAYHCMMLRSRPKKNKQKSFAPFL